jgi:hypothetical protein
MTGASHWNTIRTEAVPRYFFHITDGEVIRDDVGTELPNMDAVRRYAMRVSSDVLRDDRNSDIWDGNEWRMVVSDEAGREVFVLRFLAEQKLAA